MGLRPGCLQGSFSLLFVPLCRFIRHFAVSWICFPEAPPPSCPRGSAVPCLGQMGRSWLEPAVSCPEQPWPLLIDAALQPPWPAPGHAHLGNTLLRSGLNNYVKTPLVQQQQSKEQWYLTEMKQTLLLITIRQKFRISTAARPQSGWAQTLCLCSVL